MSPFVIELNGVQKRYGQLDALNDLTLAMAPGEVLGLFGHNGAGKTTIIKLILGLIAPSGGSVRVLEQDPYRSHNAATLRRQIGYLPENVRFYEPLTGREVLTHFARLKGYGRTECNDLLEEVGLSDASDRRVKTYSKGMRQRLGWAQALLGEPRILLLDEPTVGLDPVATTALYRTLDRLKQNGTSIILCSHVLPGVEQHIDRAAILGRGRVLAEGRLDDLRHRSRLPLTIKVKGLPKPEAMASRLQAHVSTYQAINASGLRLEVAPENKMSVLRTLFDSAELGDIDMAQPSLEQLYHHFCEAHSEEPRS